MRKYIFKNRAGLEFFFSLCFLYVTVYLFESVKKSKINGVFG